MADERAIAAVLAAERCADVHGDLDFLDPCYACRGWGAHVAAAIAALPGDDAARALDVLTTLDDGLCDALMATRHGKYDGLTVASHLERLLREVRAALAPEPPPP